MHREGFDNIQMLYRNRAVESFIYFFGNMENLFQINKYDQI